MKSALAALLVCAAAVPAFAAAPAWDSSGNSQLSGTYYFRQVLYVTDVNGNTSRAITLFGNIAFTPATGVYTLSNVSVLDSSGSNDTLSPTGTYSVSASGYGFLSNPLISGGSVIFMVSNQTLIGSSTESGYNDMFVAAPATGLTSASFSGSYTVSAFFPAGEDATYQLTPNGAGTLGNVSITGYSTAVQTYTQSSSNVKYAFSNGAYVITFPTNNSASFYSGQVYMYMSPDSAFVFGGTPGGYDMFVGVKNAAGGASTPLSGLYYEAGLDDNTGSGLDTYYGTFNAFSDGSVGSIIGHERISYSNSGNAIAYGNTYYSSYPLSISNTYQDPAGTTKYTIGQDGIRIGFGTLATISGTQYAYPSIEVGLPYTPPAPTGSVYVDPTGVVNTASSAPYTAGVSPGDFITLYNGVNLAASTVFAPPGAFQPTLGGVKVLVDGIAAPLYYVSPTQVSFLIPYNAVTFPVTSIQVSNNGVLSNTVTTYLYQTTPGVFTADPVGGDGIAAMLDFPASGAPYYIVTADNPAEPGDNVALYLTGLGTPFPTNGDGALGTADILVNTVQVDISGTSVGSLPYAGLAPDLAGLYQVNFTLPTLCASPAVQPCISAGVNSVGISGVVGSGASQAFDSYSNESYIPVGSGAGSAGAVRPVQSALRTRPRLSRPAARRP